MEQFAQFSLLESKFDHLIPYVNESKSLRRVSGQDPLISHRHRSWTGPLNFPLVSELSSMVTFKPLKQARVNGAILLNFAL